MKYLITGGCGFVGSHLADHLIAAGHEVVVLDNLSTGCYENIAQLDNHPRVFHRQRPEHGLRQVT